MGAWYTEQRAEGRNVQEAYERAIADATAEYGHQEGYSGAINSKARGYEVVVLPPRLTFRRFSETLSEYAQAAAEVEEARDDVRAYRPGGIWSQTTGAKARLRKAETALRRATAKADRLASKYPSLDLDRLSAIAEDKWGVPLAIELRPSEAKASRRGYRVYAFCGYAPS